MKAKFKIGEVLWIKYGGNKHPIKILDMIEGKEGRYYKFQGARDNSNKDNYFEGESKLIEMLI